MPGGVAKAIRPPMRAAGGSTPARLVTSRGRSGWAALEHAEPDRARRRAASAKPPAANSAANSARVRSRPPAPTIMLRSESFASASSLGPPRSRSTTSSAPSDRDRRAAAAQDAQRIVVLPVVEDRLEQVGVGALGHRLEEAARRRPRSARRRPSSAWRPTCGWSKRMPRIAGLASSTAPRKAPRPPPTSTTRREAPEVVGREQVGVGAAHDVGHRGVEDRALLRVRGAVVPDVGAVDRAERVLPRPHAVQERAPRLPVVGPADERGPGADRLGRVRAQALADRR